MLPAENHHLGAHGCGVAVPSLQIQEQYVALSRGVVAEDPHSRVVAVVDHQVEVAVPV